MEHNEIPLPGEPQTVAIIGANGFIGRNLLRRLSDQGDTQIRLLSRRSRGFAPDSNQVTVVEGDLEVAESLQALLVPGCTVVNLAYDSRSPRATNLAAARNLATACVKHRVRRLIHCSTAVVFGRSPDTIVTERSVCEPRTEYGITKLMIEDILEQELCGTVELIIVRPTAVFGPGGQGLMKLARQLLNGKQSLNYLRSCLFDQRAMNLVCVDNVTAAFQHLIQVRQNLDREIFIVSQDEDSGNNFQYVEQILMEQFKLRGYAFPRVPLPPSILSAILYLRGQDVVDPDRRYDSGKLYSTGFLAESSLEAGLMAFGKWYLENVHGERPLSA